MKAIERALADCPFTVVGTITRGVFIPIVLPCHLLYPEVLT